MTFRANKYDLGAGILVFIIAVYQAGLAFGPNIEGRFFPVIEPATLVSYENFPPPPFRTKWKAEAVKNRDCDYVVRSISWYYGEIDGRAAGIVAFFNDKPQVRDTGKLEWSELIVNLDPLQTLLQSYAYVEHKCPWRWWTTRSLFYVSPDPFKEK